MTIRTSIGIATTTLAAGGRLLSFKPGLDDIARTAHAGGDHDRIHRTVVGAGPAFHASILIDDTGLAVFHDKDALGTDKGALSTADAQIRT